MYMIFFVLDNISMLDRLLEKWNSVGVSGVTVIESTGIHRVLANKFPARYSFSPNTLIEEGHYTLISIVPDKEWVEKCRIAAEEVVGDLDEPNTGIFVAWRLSSAHGANKKCRDEQ
jgi:hypothetical protein